MSMPKIVLLSCHLHMSASAHVCMLGLLNLANHSELTTCYASYGLVMKRHRCWLRHWRMRASHSGHRLQELTRSSRAWGLCVCVAFHSLWLLVLLALLVPSLSVLVLLFLNFRLGDMFTAGSRSVIAWVGSKAPDRRSQKVDFSPLDDKRSQNHRS